MEGEQILKKWEPIDFTVYLRFALPLALIAAVVEIALRLIMHRFSNGFFIDYKEIIIWAVRIILILIISWRKIVAFGINPMIGTISGIFIGFTFGLIVSVFQLIEAFKIWKIFNIVSETIFLTVLFAGIIALVSYAFTIKNKTNSFPDNRPVG